VADTIAFIDLQAQRRRLGAPLEAAIKEAVEGGQWILGPQVAEFEKKIAQWAGVKHAVACANGTDALLLILRAWGIGPGDAVFVPAFTFAASAEVVALAGASPVFVDVLPDTFNMDPASLETAIALVKKDGVLKAKAVMPVDLFGQPADYRALAPIARQTGLRLLCDTAQAFGALLDGKRAGAIGDAATTSFFPAKPLGCYGDGGACFTNDDERNVVAGRYTDAFAGSNRIKTPVVIEGAVSTWAQYTLQVADRARFQAGMKDRGVPTAIHYPIPLSRQPAYAAYPGVPAPVSEALSGQVVSLPMHPYLEPATQDRIIAAVLASAG